MLEFWIDPDSPYQKKEFNPKQSFLFYCASGWRSALRIQIARDIRLYPDCHINGGFTAWRKADKPVEEVKTINHLK